MTSPSIVIATFPIIDVFDQDQVLAKALRAAVSEVAAYVSAACGGSGSIADFAGYKKVDGVPGPLNITGGIPGQILVSFSPPSPTGVAPTMPTVIYPPEGNCSADLLDRRWLPAVSP